MLPNIKKSHPKAAFISPVGREDSKSDLQHPMPLSQLFSLTKNRISKLKLPFFIFAIMYF
jgi:hypothetical protein